MQSKRIVFEGKDDCRIERFDPPPREPGEVRVHNLVSLISPGTELAVLRRRHRAFEAGGMVAARFRYPFYPGYAAVGVVQAVDDSSTLKEGDIVWHDGPHATDSVITADRCHAVPPGIEPEDAVFFGLVQIAMTAIRRAPVGLGDSVLVSGLGLVGMLVGRLYQISGAQVSGADFSPGRRERARRWNFDPVIDIATTPLVEWYKTRSDQQPDVTIEAAGSEPNIDSCLKVAKPGGRVVLQGSPRDLMTIDPYTDIHRKGLIIIGAHESTIPMATRRADTPYVFKLCGHRLRLQDLRTHTEPLANAPLLYDRLESNLDEYLSAVLTY